MVCGDDPRAAVLAARHGAVTYGLDAGVDVRAVDVASAHGTFTFTVEHHGVRLGAIHLPLRGVHNVANATGAVAMALTLGVPFPDAVAALGALRWCRSPVRRARA